MIGLGVGIDYALFIVTRHQDQRRDGHGDERVDRALGGDVGRRRAVRRDDGDHRAAVAGGRRHPAGHHARLHVGDRRRGRGDAPPSRCCRRCWRSSATRIDRFALPHKRGATGRHAPARLGALGAVRHAPAAAVRRVAVVVLVALALPALDLYLGQQDNGALPTDTQARQAYDGMTEGLRRRLQRPAAGQRRHVQAAGQGRPGQARPARPAGVRPEVQGQAAGRRAGAAGRREPRGAGRPAGAGPAAGPGAGAAAAQQAAAADRRPVLGPAPAGSISRPATRGWRDLRDATSPRPAAWRA